MRQEFAPHEKVGGNTPRGRRPSDGKRAIGFDPIAGDGRSEEIECLGQHRPSQVGIGKGAGQNHQRAVERDFHLRQVAEVDLIQELRHLVQVVRQPQIVIADLADESAARLTQGLIAVSLAVALALGMIEDLNARIGSGVATRDLRGFRRRAVADHEQLEIAPLLRQHRVDGERQHRRRAMDRQENRESGIVHRLAAINGARGVCRQFSMIVGRRSNPARSCPRRSGSRAGEERRPQFGIAACSAVTGRHFGFAARPVQA